MQEEPAPEKPKRKPGRPKGATLVGGLLVKKKRPPTERKKHTAESAALGIRAAQEKQRLMVEESTVGVCVRAHMSEADREEGEEQRSQLSKNAVRVVASLITKWGHRKLRRAVGIMWHRSCKMLGASDLEAALGKPVNHERHAPASQ